ncbi:hypothetical protein MHBO_004319, partial [Bonamia ostreae]
KFATQEFAWCFSELFDDYGEVLLQVDPIIDQQSAKNPQNEHRFLKMANLYLKKSVQTESEFIKNLAHALRTQKGLKPFPECYFLFEMELLNEDKFPKNRIAPSLVPMKQPQNCLDDDLITFEIDEFLESAEVYPELEYRNILYLQPLTLSSSKY